MNIFNAENITKAYSLNGFSLNDISFKLKSGHIIGVVGENGNGKTTLLRIVAGDLSINEGHLEYFNQWDNITNNWLDIKSKIAYIPQRIPKWYGYLKDNLIFEAAIRGIKGDAAEKLINELTEKLGLSEYIHLKWKEISTGYRLRFQLAKMLIGEPDLLVLDEPIANLDINAQNKFLDDLRKIVSEEGRNVSVILSSQQLHEIENIADSILFLKNGSLIYGGEVDQIGAERQENEFEIQGNFSVKDLQYLFNNIEIDFVANTYHVKVPLEQESMVFLKILIEQGFTITYFRDISSSTRKLFNN